MSLFRTASAKDYSFNSESGFWELSFDSRPVRGTRCDDPELGASQYNEARAKFKAKVKNSVKPAHVHEFIELVRWAIDSGDLAQRKVVLEMLQAESEDHYSEIKRRALRVIPSHFDFAYYWIDKNAQRFRVPVELRQEIIASIEGSE
ncbi:hypothetical protein HGT71_15515 [Rosenbergiella epipactidis]|uniref:hypothetical protein n=1 Tax=Rosenbergiella epipactidis TaxID=1544694 RepID=UPI001BD9918E|nr:hypothetical protein [Rosenbergiella epipactidis]MBT0719651.1 hypothetical protein [Rosenbergiella epipactidis]